MKKFIAAITILALTGSLTLLFFFYYPAVVILYHLLILSGITLLVYMLYRYFSYIKKKSLRTSLIHTLSFFFLLSLAIFYLVTLGSNFFWGKGIELKLMLSYIPSLNELIQSLPVQSWITYSFLIVFFLLIVLIFYWVMPVSKHLPIKKIKTDLMFSGILILLILIFHRPLLNFKNYVLFEGEPLTEFVFPKMFHTKEEMADYGETLLEKGLNDRDCIEEVKKEGSGKNSKNVVLIVLDALRSDFLSAYGYQRQTSPFLDSLVKTNAIIKIDHAFSLSTSTVAGVANLFNSKEFKDFGFSGLNLMKFMKLKNYKTYAFLTGQHLNWYGLANIYRSDCDFFYESKSSFLRSSDNDLITLKKFSSVNMNNPFFAYIHLLSTHTSGIKNEEFNKYLPNKIGLNTNKREALINNYCNGILQADYVLKQIFRKLKNSHQLDNTIIVITADHGNLFGEDGGWEHSGSVHPYVQSVPLFIYDSGQDWYKNTYSASLLDIAPTIVNRLDYKIPDCWQGTTLHNELKDFQLNIASNAECELPFGIITNRDSVLVFKSLTAQHEVKKEYQLKGDNTTWQEVNPKP